MSRRSGSPTWAAGSTTTRPAALRWSDEIFRIGGLRAAAPSRRPGATPGVHPPRRPATGTRRLPRRSPAGRPTTFTDRVVRPDGAIRDDPGPRAAGRDAAGRPERVVGIAARRHRAAGAGGASCAHQATHDPLTGLPNRALFLDRLGQALARARRDGRAVRGPLPRPRPLQGRQRQPRPRRAATGCWSRSPRGCGACLRDEDTLARLGGDEFAVLLEASPIAGEAARVAERLRARARRRRSRSTGTSIG